MSERQYHRGFHWVLRDLAVLAIVVLPLMSIAIDASNGIVVGWSMAGGIGTAVVLVLHAQLSPRRTRPLLQLCHGPADTTSPTAIPAQHRATG